MTTSLSLNYEVGLRLCWVPERKHEPHEQVTVVALRRGGSAQLSNGWVVDESGVAEGTLRRPGGRVESAG